MSLTKKTGYRKPGSDTEAFLANKTRTTRVPCFNNSQKSHSETQETKTAITTDHDGDENNYPPTTTTSMVEKTLVRLENTNYLYMPMSSAIVLKWKKGGLYVPLDFKNGLTICNLVDSRPYVSEIDPNELDGTKPQASNNIFLLNDLAIFQMQVANDSSEETVGNNHT